MIIPLTLQERLSRFKGKVKQTWKNKIQIDFESQDLNDQINKYSFFINLKNWFIRKMKIYQNNGPREVKVELSYIQKEGLWLLFESLTQFKLDGQTFEENTWYFYRRVQSFWLVNKMKQTLKQNDQIVQSYIFRMNNYQLN